MWHRSPAVRVLLGDDDRSGYEVLPMCRLEKSERAEATPKLAVGFIPPVLACDAWPGLQAEILQKIAFRLNKQRFRQVTQEAFDEAFRNGGAIQAEAYASGEPQDTMRRFFAERAARRRAQGKI